MGTKRQCSHWKGPELRDARGAVEHQIMGLTALWAKRQEQLVTARARHTQRHQQAGVYTRWLCLGRRKKLVTVTPAPRRQMFPSSDGTGSSGSLFVMPGSARCSATDLAKKFHWRLASCCGRWLSDKWQLREAEAWMNEAAVPQRLWGAGRTRAPRDF